MGRRVVFDLESNGLFPEVDKMWVFVAYDLDSKEEFVFECTNNFNGLVEFLDSCDVLVGHNILQYDLLVLLKLFNWFPKVKVKLIDTLIVSQVLNYKRFGFGHSLKKWGEFLKYPKVEHEDWSQYSPEMKNRCIVDVRLNAEVYSYLLAELNSRKNKDRLVLGIRAENAFAWFVGRAQYYGWPFDHEGAAKILIKLEKEMEAIRQLIEPKLKTKIKAVDKDPEYKSPTWVKNGNYTASLCRWFEVLPEAGQEGNRPIWGDYCRVERVVPEIGSMEAVKELLYSIGWEPDEWNYVKDAKGKLIRSTPKLTDASLEPLGEIGEAVSSFYTLRARHSVLTGWLQAIRNGRLHGDCFTIGTPTGRSRHEIIANIPAAHTAYGPEIRSLFVAPKGYVLVGVDSKGNQNRALAHYLENEKYTEAIISGDIHTFNKEILESIVGSMGEPKAARDKAKKFFYALIFAGGAGKLALIVTGKRDPIVGQRIKDEFLRKIPGLSELVKGLEKQFDKSLSATGKGYILALDGRPIFAEGARLVLNYALQSFEKITVAAAIEDMMNELDEGGFDWQPLIIYHDEAQFYVRKDQAEAARAIAERAFTEGPKRFGAMIMAGDAAIGNNWYETH